MTESNNNDVNQFDVSPAAQNLATELGINLEPLNDSSSKRKSIVGDREECQNASGNGNSLYSQKVSSDHHPEREKSIKIRRLLARKMEKAWQTIPHVYVTIAVDMTDVVRLYRELDVTINDFIIAATARALVEHPWVNATWNGEQGVELSEINIAMATATDRGLYYPVLHNCPHLTLRQISTESKMLAEKAASGNSLTEDETSGGTFTITNMGMFGVESFGAIITPPQAAVLSVGAVKGEFVVDNQGGPNVALMMRLTLSADHRVLDGADASEFLGTIKSYLEAPIVLTEDGL